VDNQIDDHGKSSLEFAVSVKKGEVQEAPEL
jgi:hypothetical protein